MSALDDLIARDSVAPSGGSALDALISRDAGPAGLAASAPPPQAAPGSTPWDAVMRQVGLTARAGVTGLTGLPAMAGDALNGAVNLGIHGVNSLTGSNISPLEMPSSVVQNAMTSIGVPEPQNALERVVQSGTSAMAGTGPFVAAGKAITAATSPFAVGASASPTAQIVGQGMAKLPGMQIAGAAGAGTAGSIARENGVGPFGQIVAGALGGMVGATVPSAGLAAARGIRGVARNIGGVVEPIVSPQNYVGKQLAQALRNDPSVAQNLGNVPEYVPGSLPTTAQAGANPTLVATEKSFANANPDFKVALAAREAENNAARWQALNGVSRTPEDLEQAVAARSAVTKPLYEAAHAQVVPVDDALTTLVARPSLKQAMESAHQLAKDEGVPIQWPTADSPMISGKALDYTNRALSDLIGNAKSANQPERVRALTGAQAQLQSWITKNVPGVKEASSDYATFSSPVNTMEAGQQIAAALGNRAMDVNGLPKIQLSPYKTALVQALKKQEYGIDSGAQQSLQGIGQDLQRATISNSLRSPGSDTAYNIAANGWLGKQIYGENFNGASGLGRGLGALAATVTGHPYVGLGVLAQGNKLGQLAGGRLNEQLAKLLLDPAALAPYVNKPAPPIPPALLQRLRGDVSQGLVGAAAAGRAGP